jgi:CubicO group peptidase (beta-lactamase class C family)
MSTARRYRLLLAGIVVLALALPLVATAENAPKVGLAEVVKPFVEKHTLAGAVMLVADKDKILTLEAAGYADLMNDKLMTTDTIFWIASQSKPITAVGLMMLVDEGKANLDDPVAKYLPELKDMFVEEKGKERHKAERTMTVRHLLSHMSGMPFKSAAEEPTLDLLSLKDKVLSYAKTPLQSEPGTRYSYSNAGINSAGRIIEVVTGMSYEDFLQKRLFDPLGMKDTTFWPHGEQLKRLAKAYKPGPNKTGLEETPIGQLKYPLDDRKRQPMPAGGLFATATDMSRFGRMLLNNGTFEGHRYLSQSALQEMTRKQTGELKDNYGLGFSVNGDGFGHGGALGTQTWIDRKRGLVTVWLALHAGFPGDGSQAQGAFRKAAEARFGAK